MGFLVSVGSWIERTVRVCAIVVDERRIIGMRIVSLVSPPSFREIVIFHCSLTFVCWRNRPMKLLRTFPPLKAKEIIPLAVQFSGDISPELYDAVVRHPWDDTLMI